MKTKIILALFISLISFQLSAQIVYDNNRLMINGNGHPRYNFSITGWPGMYWALGSDRFFLLDLYSASPSLAGSQNQIDFYNPLTNSYNLIRVGNVFTFSDGRAKENVKTITTGLNSVLQLRPVSYKWKKSEITESAASKLSNIAFGPYEDESVQYGFLAQEVESVLPDAVKTDADGRKLINYTAIIPLLVEAVQELQATVEAQAEVLSKIQNRNFIEVSAKSNSNRIVSCTPNPTSGQVSIEIETENTSSVMSLLISDLTGSKLADLDVDSTIATYNASNLKPGIYLVSLYVNGALADSKRLIKE